MSCHVKYCRFNNSHTTRGHKCGNCKRYGHGVIECNTPSMNILKIYTDEVKDRCTFIGCRYPQYHTTEAHHCNKCNGRLHMENTCSLNNIIKCPLCKQNNNNTSPIYSIQDECCICLDNKVNIYFNDCNHACICNVCLNKMQNKNSISIKLTDEMLQAFYMYPSFITIQIGMGNSIIIKKNNNSYEELIMDSDLHDMTKYNEFVYGYVDTKKTFVVEI